MAGKIGGKLHDIGKLTEVFNNYIHNVGNSKRGDIDHSFAGAKFLLENFSGADKSFEQKTAALIGRVILTHHGLCDWINDYSESTYQRRTQKGKDDFYDEILSNFKGSELEKEVKSDFEQAVKEVRTVRKKLKEMSDKPEAFAFYLGMLERFLLSCLIDADRIDTADFMSKTQSADEYDTQTLWQEMQIKLEEKLKEFSKRSDNISKQRQSISDRCFAYAAGEVKICRLLVPTGGGKTLSSLRFACEYAKRNQKKKIIYIAPFMSILEQNSMDIRELAGDTLLEHHSNMLADIAKEKSDDALQEYELHTERWDSPVIATTMVQFLNSLFSGQTSSVRRMHRLSEAVIIIDEVQSVPQKCVYLFNLAMNFLSQICGSTIVLCSATQPPFEELDEFPLMLDENPDMTGDVAEDFAAFARTQLIYEEKTGGFGYDEASDFCRRKFSENGSLLVVVNTKIAAKEMFNRLKNTSGAKVFHLSTNMCPKHRRECIDLMKDMLSKKEPVICVTTQLIEAGVDISFGCVVRSLAGLDNAAQAAGRCNRSGEFHKICPVYVLHLRDEKLGSLSEIKEAQDVCREIFGIPDISDYLGVDVQKKYFSKLFKSGDGKRKLRYKLNNIMDIDLINLLSLNINRAKDTPYKFCGQAFRTAGKEFEVIDSNTRAVIVPFDKKAQEIIASLSTEKNPNEIVKLLRLAQQYAVNLYDNKLRELEKQSAVYNLNCGGNENTVVTILHKEFYDKNLGVTDEGGLHEVLII